MVLTSRLARKQRDDRLSNAIVAHFHGFDPVAQPRAHQAARSKKSEERRGRLSNSSRLAHRRHGKRTATNGDDLKKPARVRRKTSGSLADDLLQRQRRRRRPRPYHR